MACRGSERALGGVRPPGGREAISSSSRTQTDPHPSQGTGGAASLSVGGCQTEKGIVEWVTREPLLSTECRAIPSVWPVYQFERFCTFLVCLTSIALELTVSSNPTLPVRQNRIRVRRN